MNTHYEETCMTTRNAARASGRNRGNGRHTRETWMLRRPPGHTARGMDVNAPRHARLTVAR
eukprot:4514113-Lingulodinium_polyedra.AAC.1